MESAPNTNPRLKPAAPYSSDPRERFEAQRMEGCVFRTNVTGDFGIVTEDSGPS